MVTQTDDGAYRCLPNASNVEPERRCGVEGQEACLDAATGVYSCASPSVDGATVRAVQPANADVSTVTFVCERCGVRGSRVCACDPHTPCPPERAGHTSWCGDDLELTVSASGHTTCEGASSVDALAHAMHAGWVLARAVLKRVRGA